MTNGQDGARRIRVVVVDDSVLIRALLRAIINEAPDMECVGVAADAASARTLIRESNPDLITLDVEMPGMDGLDFLDKIMRLRPMPVVMMSSLTERGSEVALRALELGAVDVIAKPKGSISEGLGASTGLIHDTLRAAAGARLSPYAGSGTQFKHAPHHTAALPAVPAQAHGARQAVVRPPSPAGMPRIIAIGASTGGTEAIKDVLIRLPTNLPGIVITQHMPERFTRSFAERLDKLAAITVREAAHGDVVQPGHAYVAPGHSHLSVSYSAGQFRCELGGGAPVNRHRPSVDVLFDSVARLAGGRAVGVLLTGMGRDGAAGLLHMREAGAHTIAQSESTCVVYGMPREAVALGGASEVVDLPDIAGRIVANSRGG